MLISLESAYSLLGGPNGNALRLIAKFRAEVSTVELAELTASEAILICNWHHDNIGLANTMRTLAQIYQKTGNFTLAKHYSIAALGASRQTSDILGVTKALIALGNIAAKENKPRRSDTIFISALKNVFKTSWDLLAFWHFSQVVIGISLNRIHSLLLKN